MPVAVQEDSPTLDQLKGVLGSDANESAADTMRGVIDEMAKGSAPEPDDVDVGEKETAKADRKRDEVGRFAKGEPEATEPADKPDTKEGGPVAAKAPEVDAEVDEPTEPDIEPPASWSLADQQAFRAIPNEARKLVLDRATQAEQAASRAQQYTARYGALEQIVGPRRQEWARMGMDEAGAIRQLLALSDMAAQNPLGFVQMFVRDRGLPPDQVVQRLFPHLMQGDQGQQVPHDPRVNQLEQYVLQMKQEAEQRKQQDEAVMVQKLSSSIDNFAAAKDETGRLKYPHFGEVRHTMGALILQDAESDPDSAPDIEAAYHRACRANDAVFAKIEAARQAQAERDRAKEQRKKAAAAGKAGSSISGTPGDRERPEPTGDVREDMRRQFAERGLI